MKYFNCIFHKKFKICHHLRFYNLELEYFAIFIYTQINYRDYEAR